VLVESSPAAILTVDSKGEILLANQAAQEILAPGKGMITGSPRFDTEWTILGLARSPASFRAQQKDQDK
jgi:PAS domain-containing protein